ncbi:MAG: hypothetical protein JWO59_1528, partial [Chloroflexi bacterium]|nr:hypothetical protein [Chloroflexota bacterium]
MRWKRDPRGAGAGVFHDVSPGAAFDAYAIHGREERGDKPQLLCGRPAIENVDEHMRHVPNYGRRKAKR